MEHNQFGKSFAICTFVFILLSSFLLLNGCESESKPRLRAGAFFGSPAWMDFPNPEKLGTHHFGFSLNEKNGMVYTCKAGFIDIGHLREAADRTAYLAAVTYRNLMLKKSEFWFRVIEPSRYWVKVSYPENWEGQSVEEKERIANEVSIHLGQYFAHTSMVWHEILTWYGFSTTGIFSDRISSFSWEDTYSDLLGTSLAVEALRTNQQRFDDSMTKLIDQTLNDLEVQPSAVARQAAKQIKGEWFTGGMYFFVEMKKQNFDIGLDDGQITAMLVPGICDDGEAQPFPVPSQEIVSQYGFEMKLEIEPRVWEKNKIYDAIGLEKTESRLEPKVHYPKILEHINNQAR